MLFYSNFFLLIRIAYAYYFNESMCLVSLLFLFESVFELSNELVAGLDLILLIEISKMVDIPILSWKEGGVGFGYWVGVLVFLFYLSFAVVLAAISDNSTVFFINLINNRNHHGWDYLVGTWLLDQIW